MAGIIPNGCELQFLKRMKLADLLSLTILMYFQMHINLTTVVEFSRQLTAYTRGASLFSDKMDVIYLAYIMEKLIVFVDEVEDVRCLLYAEKKYHLEMKS